MKNSIYYNQIHIFSFFKKVVFSTFYFTKNKSLIYEKN